VRGHYSEREICEICLAVRQRTLVQHDRLREFAILTICCLQEEEFAPVYVCMDSLCVLSSAPIPPAVCKATDALPVTTSTFARLRRTCSTARSPQMVAESGCYSTECCDEELVFDSGDRFLRCPRCQYLCEWEYEYELLTPEDLEQFNGNAA
jgi:hypothetical protein